MSNKFAIQKKANLSERQFYDEYVRGRVPVILTDAAERSGWAALKNWTAGYLTDVAGSNEVTVRGGNFHVNAANVNCRFAEVVEAATISSLRNPMPYMYGVDIAEKFPQLLPDISDLLYYFPDRLR